MPLPPSAADDDDDGLIIKVPSIERTKQPRRSDSKTGGAEFDTLLDEGGQLNKGVPISHRFENTLRENIVPRLRNSFPHMPEDFLCKHSKNAPPSLPLLSFTHTECLYRLSIKASVPSLLQQQVDSVSDQIVAVA